MSKPVVVFDIDGVLADFTYGFSGVLHGVPRHQGTQETWEFDAPQKDVSDTWKFIDKSTEFWLRLPCLLTSREIDATWELVRKADLVYMTGREDRKNQTEDQSFRWLEAHGFPAGQVILQGDKLQGVRDLGVPVAAIIDDKPGTVEKLFMADENIYVRDWQYNRNVVSGIKRVSSVAEFCHRVMKELS